MSEGKSWWQIYKKEIGLGIVTSIASSTIIWLAQWLVQTAPEVGKNLPATIENIIYAKASSVTEYTPFLVVSGLLQIFIFSIVLTGIIMYTVHDIRLEHELKKRAAPILHPEKTSNISEPQNSKSTERKPATKSEQLAKDLERLKAEQTQLHKEWKSLQRRSWGLLAGAVILLVVIASIFQMFALSPIELKAKFDLSIQIIEPYVDDETVEKLRSDWILMKSAEDHAVIQSTIDDILNELDIQEIYWSTSETILSGKSEIVP